MRVFRHLSSLPPAARGAVAALGNFDGVHRGHQAVLAETRRIARALGAPAAVMTFRPHPRAFFNPEAPPLNIYPLHHKLRLLREAGTALIYLPRFDADFACLSAERFVTELLAGALGVRHVVTGENFSFGHRRGGTAAALGEIAARCGFGATQVPGVADASNASCSSTRIRAHLAAGEVEAASRLLGRPYAVMGRVRHGDGRGRQLGFPTANLGVERIFLPAAGVYAAQVRREGGEVLRAVINLGVRPTVGGAEPLLEAHCLDFQGDLYHERLHVVLLRHLRPERKFASLSALKEQIARDVQIARAFFT